MRTAKDAECLDIDSENTSFLKGQLQKPSEDSKKWKMTILGLKGIAGMFLVGGAMFIFKPDLASQTATLVQFGLTAWGGIVSIYLGAQGSVDFKTTAAFQQVNKTESIKQDIVITEKYDPDVERKFSEQFAGDESYRPISTVPKEKEGFVRPE